MKETAPLALALRETAIIHGWACKSGKCPANIQTRILRLITLLEQHADGEASQRYADYLATR